MTPNARGLLRLIQTLQAFQLTGFTSAQADPAQKRRHVPL